MYSPTRNLSPREKALFKRRVNKEHNSNLRAGYVQVTEDQLNKTGIRGRKLVLLYFILLLLFVVASVNIIITILLLKMMNIDQNGMKSLEFMSSGKTLHFKEESEFGKILLVQNELTDLGNGLQISGTNRNLVNIGLSGSSKTKLTLDYDIVEVSNVHQFSAKDPDSGKMLFTTNDLKFPKDVRNVRSQKTVVDKISSPPGKDLDITSADTGKIDIIGRTRIKLESDTLELSAREDLHLSTNKSMFIESRAGVFLHDVLNLPKVPLRLDYIPSNRLQVSYKLCLCAYNARLFQVPHFSSCHEGGFRGHPCH